MGRRTTSTTKGGRYMNPADQERKMARKKELKKNKKQRHMVRQAVLKSKDPSDLLVQMEKLDEMEFSDFDAQPLSERVIQEKRNKLRETFVRVLGMYKRENEMEKFQDLKKQLQAYDQKRLQLQQQFIAQKFAREVDPSEIPLPDSAPPAPDAAAAMTPAAALASRGLAPNAQPFPPHLMITEFGQFAPGFDPARSMGAFGKTGVIGEPLHGILKKSRKRSAFPPGPPIGLPPDLSESSDDDDYHDRPRRSERSSSGRDRRRYGSGDDELASEDEEDEDDDARARRHSIEEAAPDQEEYDDDGNLVSSRPARVRFNQGGGVDDEEKDSRSRYKELAKKIERGEMPSQAVGRSSEVAGGPAMSVDGACIPPPPSLTMMSPGVIGGPPRLMRPPIPLPGLGSIGPGVRIPPPPPPGFPPSRIQRPLSYVGHVPGAAAAVAAVLSAPPAINKPKQANLGAVIEAKPQLRNMQQEVTKLVPTALKVRREQHAPAAHAQKKPAKGPLIFRTPEAKISVPGGSVQHAPQKSSDEAYDEFMKEMNSLL